MKNVVSNLGVKFLEEALATSLGILSQIVKCPSCGEDVLVSIPKRTVLTNRACPSCTFVFILVHKNDKIEIG